MLETYFLRVVQITCPGTAISVRCITPRGGGWIMLCLVEVVEYSEEADLALEFADSVELL